jgi:hypothetical protein
MLLGRGGVWRVFGARDTQSASLLRRGVVGGL